MSTYTREEGLEMFEACKKMSMIAQGLTEEQAYKHALQTTKVFVPRIEEYLTESITDSIPDSDEVQKVEKPESQKAESETKVEGTPIVETKVDSKPEDQKADMAQGRQAVINIGGVKIDPNKINQGIAEEIDPSNPARVLLQQNQQPPVPNMVPNQGQVFSQQPVPMDINIFNPGMMQQPMPQQPGMCTCGDPNCPGGHGDIVIPMGDKIRVLHRIDEAPKQKPAVAKEDNVDVNMKDVNMMNGLIKPKPKTMKPEFIETLPQGEPIDHSVEKNVVDNSPLIAKIDKVPLDAVEKIANANGHSVAFYEFPAEGIISVITYGINGQLVEPKCFCIDTGKIIDARAKLITAVPMLPISDPTRSILECSKFYELFVIDPKTHKKILDTQLLNDIFSAGHLNVKKRQMYSDEYLALNRKLALITIPTKGLNKEQRNAIQTFLVESLDKPGYLDKAISKTPTGCRFAFLDDVLDKNNLANFTLVNKNVPLYYGTDAPAVINTLIKVKNGKVSIVVNGEEVPLN